MMKLLVFLTLMFIINVVCSLDNYDNEVICLLYVLYPKHCKIFLEAGLGKLRPTKLFYAAEDLRLKRGLKEIFDKVKEKGKVVADDVKKFVVGVMSAVLKSGKK
ncbi:hypothetical protein HELRODRAFT_173445 [Helobdella robusta]|uniref:Uncharacterized protein n=1 Tax=Helobdella robusta TaxID=6412 RepID=T1F6U2_HELRO|nr:hypothetical protein HELRODRAFT_173445 [Helobdella robusta]ESO03744.1 hypothetical protein HELRODRAFT_173445 [Helobdella robusta]